MTKLVWSNDFSTGVASIDHEHQELIELINVICEALEANNKDEVPKDILLDELYAKIAAHFALEEKVMREQHYYRYIEHKADHEKLLDELREIMDNEEDSAASSAEKLIKSLSNWFGIHFKTEDARFHRHQDSD